MADDLTGRVGLDINPFMAGMRRLQAAAAPAGKNIAQQFRSGFMRFFGAGAVISAVQRSLSNAAEIRRESAKRGMDVETYQALEQISQQTGHSVDDLSDKILNNADASEQSRKNLQEWIKEIKEMGTVIDQGTVERLAQIFTTLQQLFNRLAPILAYTLDMVRRIYDFAAKGIEAAVAGAISLGGKITGNKEWQQIGREMAQDVFGGEKDSIFKAFSNWWKDTAAPEVKKTREIKLPEKKQKEKREGIFTPEVGAMARTGGYMFGARPLMEQVHQTSVLEQINTRVGAIQSDIKGQLSD